MDYSLYENQEKSTPVNQSVVDPNVPPPPPVQASKPAQSKKNIWLWVLVILGILILLGCLSFAYYYFYVKGGEVINPAQVQNNTETANWSGSYTYSEGVEAAEGFPHGFAWSYDLELQKNENGYKGVLNINGNQTLIRWNVLAKENSGKLDIFFDSIAQKDSMVLYDNGDLLFSLEKNTNNTYKIIWGKFEPMLEQSRNENNEFEKISETADCVEHTYEGDIAKGKHVTMTLSCDEETFTISGAVNQIIRYVDIKEDSLGLDLVFLDWNPEVVDFDSDYNSDGYNDLSSLVMNGSRVRTYNIFLYDSKTNTFIFNKELSDLSNIYLDPETKEIISEAASDCHVPDPCAKSEYYRWVNGHLQLIEK